MNFLKGLLDAVLTGAAKTVASADGTGSIKTTGVIAGAGGIAGALLYLLTHPIAAHPAAQNAVQIVAAPAPKP